MEDKAKQKEGFFLKKNYYSLIKFLSNEEKGLLFEAIFLHEIEDKKYNLSNTPILIPLYEFITNELKNNNVKYNLACEKKSISAKKNWTNKTKKETVPKKEETKEEDKLSLLTPEEIEKNRIFDTNAEQKRLLRLLK